MDWLDNSVEIHDMIFGKKVWTIARHVLWQGYVVGTKLGLAGAKMAERGCESGFV